MLLNFEEKNINMLFEVTAEGQLLLLSCLNKKKKVEENYKAYNVCSAVAVHIAGENPDDHHGAKHTGTSCEKTLKYVNHSYSKNEQGNKLEFELKNDKIKVNVGGSVRHLYWADRWRGSLPEYFKSGYVVLDIQFDENDMPYIEWCDEFLIGDIL